MTNRKFKIGDRFKTSYNTIIEIVPYDKNKMDYGKNNMYFRQVNDNKINYRECRSFASPEFIINATNRTGKDKYIYIGNYLKNRFKTINYKFLID